jgi:GlpG protein
LRQIGTLPKNLDPQVLGDHLLSQGMKTRFDERPDGWLVWIYDENQVSRAQGELMSYLDHPDDPRFVAAGEAAQAVRRKEQQLDREYRKNFRFVTDQWSGLRVRRRPLTMALVVISLLVFLLGESPAGAKVENALLISTRHYDPHRGLVYDNGLAEVEAGQVWRLVTPIFLHFGLLHIVFNCWATIVEGTLIETARGTLPLAALVLVSAVASNLGQYYFMDLYGPGTVHSFGGLSGVGYAMFGYLWMKGMYEPEQGMILHPNTISTMLIWLVLCMTGLLGPIANAAHVVGLVVGILFGVFRF